MNFRDLLNIFEQGAPPPKPLPYKGSQDAQVIARASGVKNVNVIKPDQVLTLPDGGSYTVQKGDTLDKIARRNKTAPAADPNQAAVNAANKVQTDQTAAVAAANANPAAADKPPAPPAAAPAAAPAANPGSAAAGSAFNQGNLGSRADPDATAAQPAAQPAAAAPAAEPAAEPAANPGTGAGGIAFNQGSLGTRAPEPQADPAGGPKPASYMYQAGKANPNYDTGAGQPQWVTMNDVNSKPAAPSGNAVQRSITAPQDAAMPLPANISSMSPADAATELRAAQAGADKPVLEPGAQVVGTGTGGSTTTGTGGLLTTRSPDQIEWDSNKSNYGKQYPGAEKAAQQAADQKASGDRNLSRVKNFFGFGDKSKAADNPNIGVKSNMAQNRMRESDDALSELMRLSGRSMQEKAPPGAKAERQVKHVKAGYAKDGKLTNKEKSIAYATAWKQHNKSKVSESVMLEAGSALEHIIKKFKHETKNFLAGNDLDNDLYDALYDYYSDNGEIPYGVAKARDGDPIQWVSDRFADEMQMHGYGRQSDMLNMPGHDHELTELARLAGLSESQVSECGDMDSMEQHDSMSVSTNMSSDGTKSVNISAQGDRADSLLQMLKMAGMRPYDDHEHAGMTEPEVIMISSEPQHDDMHDEMMHNEEMMDEEYANEAEQEYHSIGSILRQGDDLNREKAQHPVAGFTGDNPMSEEVALDEELQSLLDSILIKDGIKVGPMGGPDDISKVHVPYVEPKSKYSSSVLDAEKPYRDEKTGKMITPPRGATMPPPDSQYAPGDQRNMMPPKRK